MALGNFPEHTSDRIRTTGFRMTRRLVATKSQKSLHYLRTELIYDRTIPKNHRGCAETLVGTKA